MLYGIIGTGGEARCFDIPHSGHEDSGQIQLAQHDDT